MKKTLMTAAAVLLLAMPSAEISGRTIYPEDFESITGTSINILQSYTESLKLVDAGGLLFYSDFNILIGPEGRHTIATIFGDDEVYLEQRDVNFYWNVLKLENYEAALFVIMSSTILKGGLSVWDAVQGEYVSYNWGKLHTVVGLRAILFRDFRFSAGLLAKRVPYIETGGGGARVFGVHDVPGKGLVEDDFYYDLFLHTDIYGFDLRTALDFSGGPIFEIIQLRKMFEVQDWGSLGGSVSYQRFLNTATVGLIGEDFNLWGFLNLSGEVFYDFNRDLRGSSIAHSLLEGTLMLFGSPERRTGKGRELYLSIKAGSSYDREMDPAGLWGGMWELAVNNMNLLGSFGRISLGTATNYYKMLNRYPIKGETVFCFDARWEFDTFDMITGAEKK